MASSGSFNTSGYDNRYLTFSWTVKSQSIENNETVISYTLKGAGSRTGYYHCRNTKLVIDGETVYYQGEGTSTNYIKLYNGTVVTSGEFTISHESDGSRDFDVYVEAGIYVWAVNCTGSETFTLDTIPRASSLTAANGTLGTEQTLTINRASGTFKHRLTYSCGDVAEYIAGGLDSYTTATSIKWTPRIGLASENTTGTSVTVKLTLYTYTSDGTHVGTKTETITCAIPASVKPSCSIAWEDTSGAAGTYGSPVQGLSKLKITVTAKTSYDSPIASYSVTANGATYTAATATTGALTDAGDNKIAATVKDQRGRSGSASVTLDVLAYSAPVVSKLTVHRCDGDGAENDQGDYVEVIFSAAITDLAGKNPAAYKLRYKANSDTQYTELTFTDLAGVYAVTNYAYIFAADGNNSYDVEIVATDNHGTATRATSASTAFTLMNWHNSGTGMGVGKVAETENTVEFGLDADFRNPVYGMAYGLGALPAIPENADFDDYMAPGCYAVRQTAIAETVSNIPVPVAGRLIVSSATGQNDADVNALYAYREQRFVPYMYGRGAVDRGAWIRYAVKNNSTEWTIYPWYNEAIKAYPVGSIYLAYNHTDPATLFGGSWTRISSYLLRGATASGTIGETGTLADGSGRSYINISIWRRTA